MLSPTQKKDETTIFLSAALEKPVFLATVKPVEQSTFTLPETFELNGYTREPWSSGKNNHESCYLVCTDERNKLPGFMQYLKERKN